jgi:hypothetical protein
MVDQQILFCPFLMFIIYVFYYASLASFILFIYVLAILITNKNIRTFPTAIKIFLFA